MFKHNQKCLVIIPETYPRARDLQFKKVKNIATIIINDEDKDCDYPITVFIEGLGELDFTLEGEYFKEPFDTYGHSSNLSLSDFPVLKPLPKTLRRKNDV